MKVLSVAEIVPIKLMGYYNGKQTTRQISIILEGEETYDKIESACMKVCSEIYYNTNTDPFGETKTRRFTVQCKRKKLRVNTSLNFMAFYEVFGDELRTEINRKKGV